MRGWGEGEEGEEVAQKKRGGGVREKEEGSRLHGVTLVDGGQLVACGSQMI